MKYVIIVTVKTDTEWAKGAVRRDVLAKLERATVSGVCETLKGAKVRIRSIDKD